MVFIDQLVDAVGEAGRDDLVPAIAQREGQQFRNLWRVVDQQDARHERSTFDVRPTECQAFEVTRGFFPAAGSRSSTQIRPPAVKYARRSLSIAAPQASSVRIANVYPSKLAFAW